ncbi:hypothetical protein X566_23420 [Afipia sp. P52-10]|nr:hypothetical protein X566_23420 [Afipia sp. P52-10]
MQAIPFLVFVAVPVFAALAIDTEAFVPFLILFFAIAGLSTAHPLYDGAEWEASQGAGDRRESMRQTDAAQRGAAPRRFPVKPAHL